MRVRIALIAALASVAVMGMITSNAVAAPGSHGSSNVQSVPPQYTMDIHGKAKNGKKFNGTYGIERFVVSNGHVYALGILKGTLNGRHVTRNNVKLPAKLTPGSAKMSADNKSARATTPPPSCSVLNLVLGPVDLNLLGLEVKLGGGTGANLPITLQLIAHPSGTPGGGLLGDLLCGLNNALSGSGVLATLSGELQQLQATLNSILGLLSTPPGLGGV